MKESLKEINKLFVETKNLVEAMLEVVLPDFARITEILKRLARPEDQELLRAYSAIVQELQYYDTLTQKMEHITLLHELILSSATQARGQVRQVSGLSLVRLNHIQFQVSCFEYLSSVNEIENNLFVLADYYNLNRNDYRFQHSNLLLSASRFINKNFMTLEQLLGEETEADLHGKIEVVNTIYSMESERSVLKAYLNKPKLTDLEIEPLHKSTTEKPEIELF